MEAELSVCFGEGCGEWLTEHHTGWEVGFQAFVQVFQGEFSPTFVGRAGAEYGAVGVGWVAELLAEFEFLVGVAGEIVVSGELD